jgi:hypothetical protein
VVGEHGAQPAHRHPEGGVGLLQPVPHVVTQLPRADGGPVGEEQAQQQGLLAGAMERDVSVSVIQGDLAQDADPQPPARQGGQDTSSM